MTKTWLALAMGVALFAAVPAVADEPKKDPPPAEPKKEGLPADLIDPEFDRYVDLKLLGEAINKAKAAQVADIALKLAEGERKLSRKHKAISADKVFDLAVRVSFESKDKDTMAKLLEAAKAAKNTTQIENIERFQKVMANNRVTDPDAALLARATAEHVVVFRALADQVRTAKLVANRGQIDGLEKTINKLDNFDTGLKESLIKKVADARKVLPDKDDPETDVLARLTQSR